MNDLPVGIWCNSCKVFTPDTDLKEEPILVIYCPNCDQPGTVAVKLVRTTEE